jgi:hypothetical protein
LFLTEVSAASFEAHVQRMTNRTVAEVVIVAFRPRHAKITENRSTRSMCIT